MRAGGAVITSPLHPRLEAGPLEEAIRRKGPRSLSEPTGGTCPFPAPTGSGPSPGCQPERRSLPTTHFQASWRTIIEAVPIAHSSLAVHTVIVRKADGAIVPVSEWPTLLATDAFRIRDYRPRMARAGRVPEVSRPAFRHRHASKLTPTSPHDLNDLRARHRKRVSNYAARFASSTLPEHAKPAVRPFGNRGSTYRERQPRHVRNTSPTHREHQLTATRGRREVQARRHVA